MKIFNTYDQLRQAVHKNIIPVGQAVAISRGDGCWQVESPYFKTDEKAAWYNYGRKTFLYGNRAKSKEQFEAAKMWAQETYGITEWQRNTSRDYVPKIVNDALPIPKRKQSET